MTELSNVARQIQNAETPKDGEDILRDFISKIIKTARPKYNLNKFVAHNGKPFLDDYEHNLRSKVK